MLGKLIRTIVPAHLRPVGYLEGTVWKHVDGKVADGPFKGMKYVDQAYYSAYIPKLLGIYERELYPVVEHAIASRYPLIVDIGAAEGYYACGMALRSPDSRVVAYEGEADGRALLKKMADQNGLGQRIEIKGYCNRAEMKALIADVDRALLIVDCEGYEHILLDPLRCPDLSKCSILVECHDFLVAGLTDELKERFSPTHHIEQIYATLRKPDEYPVSSIYTKLLGKKKITHFVNEWRPGQMWWLWMTPKS